MRIFLITGGARSGKSEHAVRLARELGGDDVTFIATATADDDEMRARIERHRAERSPEWQTVEAAHDAAAAVTAASHWVVVLDCLTLLASNALLRADEAGADPVAAVRAEADALVNLRDTRDGTLVVVTNEVGLGIVPDNRLGRLYRDALGEANRAVAAAAERVVMMVSGIPLQLK